LPIKNQKKEYNWNYSHKIKYTEESPEQALEGTPEHTEISEHHLTLEKADKKYLVDKHPQENESGIVINSPNIAIEVLKSATDSKIEVFKKNTTILNDMSIDAQTRVNAGMDIIGDVPILGTVIKRNPLIGAASVFNEIRKDVQEPSTSKVDVIVRGLRNTLNAFTFGIGTKVLDTIRNTDENKVVPVQPVN
jgi:hypothetical protein